MRQTVAVSLPPELASELDAVAEREGASRSEIVRDALRRYLAVREFQRLRESLVPFAEAQDILTDEDVFRNVS
jgi:metal-responsive CopG/Arc/MetJ family transcriptional regulator